MKLKVYPESNHQPGGITSVLEDHRQLLHEHSFVATEEEADLIIVHAHAKAKGEPDITYTHGLYPTQDRRWPFQFQWINKQIFNNIANSLQAVAVSHWGGELLTRYCGVKPAIIHNGIFYKEYTPGGNKLGPSLWPKTTLNPVCDPKSFIQLAETFQEDKFTSFLTLPHAETLQPMSRAEIKKFLKTCSLLIATTKENDSLLIMEAMASGIPVLAYKWGMTGERLQHKQGCYLANTLPELLKGYQYLKENWTIQSEIAHLYAAQFDWELQKPKLNRLFEETLHEKSEPARVSIIIPCHNYGRFVGQAIQSAKKQSFPCEVIVVDDGSEDDSLQVIQENKPDKILQNLTAQGVAQARNAGILAASGNLIVCLDADDVLAPNFVKVLLSGFTRRNIAICFSPIQIIDEKGRNLSSLMFTREPNIHQHQKGLNQVPSCCMFRRRWWERADGYDHFLSFTEDANLWLKIFLLGGQAKRATTHALMYYRRHPQNNSLKPPSPWVIFHEQPFVLAQEDLTLLIDGSDLNARHTYWRLKELAYPIRLNTDTIPSNYLRISPGPDALKETNEKWTQLFSFLPGLEPNKS